MLYMFAESKVFFKKKMIVYQNTVEKNILLYIRVQGCLYIALNPSRCFHGKIG